MSVRRASIARALPALAALVAAVCAPTTAQVQAAHARRFGCEARWVRARDEGGGRVVATGCGFSSEWACADGRCALRDQRAFGADAP